MDFKIVLTNGETRIFKNARVRDLTKDKPQTLSEVLKSVTDGSALNTGVFKFTCEDAEEIIRGTQIKTFGFASPTDY